jgi:hypothetical protein
LINKEPRPKKKIEEQITTNLSLPQYENESYEGLLDRNWLIGLQRSIRYNLWDRDDVSKKWKGRAQSLNYTYMENRVL